MCRSKRAADIVIVSIHILYLFVRRRREVCMYISKEQRYCYCFYSIDTYNGYTEIQFLFKHGLLDD